jgi:GNAT superfamily N-acetyltransferase
MSVDVREVTLEEAAGVNRRIPEFSDTKYSAKDFADRVDGKDPLVIVGYVYGKPAGYLISYDRYNDRSHYCWLAGVDPEFRRNGVLKAMFDYSFDWAKEHGYGKITIKTRNKFRAMLANLVKYGFMFTEVQKAKDINEYRILLEKEL